MEVKGTHENPLFRASDIGEILCLSNIRASINDFDNTERDDVNTIDTIGRPQKTTFLTEKGLYKLLFRSRKPIAEQFQNWVCDVVKELRIQGTYSLQNKIETQQKQLETQKQDYETKIKNTKETERHTMLLRDFGSIGEIVYIIRVKTFENGCYIVKIGCSENGVDARYKEHRKNYEEAVILDCFSVLRFSKFEKFIHNHQRISPSKYKKLEGHEKENELFLIGESLSYFTIIDVIQSNIKRFNEYSDAEYKLLEERIEKLTIENELLKLKLAQNENFTQVDKNYEPIFQKLENIEEQIQKMTEKNTASVPSTPYIQHQNLITGFGNLNKTVGPRLQKINPDTLTVVKVYEYLEEVIKESNNTIKRPSIEKAIKEATVYQGFRWNYVARDQDPTDTANLPPTKQIKTPSVGYIAKLDAEQTHIINIYIDRKTAATENGFSASGLDTPVKNKKTVRGNMYMLFSECNQKIQDEFIAKKCTDKPLLLFKDGIGQYDAEQKLVREFACKYDCINELKMSDKTMSRALEKNAEYNGFFYKKLAPRLYI